MTQPPDERPRPQDPEGDITPEGEDRPGPDQPGDVTPDNEPTVAWTPPGPDPEKPPEEGGVGYAAIPDPSQRGAAQPGSQAPAEPVAASEPAPHATPAPPSGPIISATPAAPEQGGWQTPETPPAGQPTPTGSGWEVPAAVAGPAAAAPGAPADSGWVAPAPGRQEIAPGLTYSDTLPRVVAYLIDLFLIAIVAGVIGGALGWSGAVVAQPVDLQVDRFDYSRFVTPEGTILNVVLSALYFIVSWTGGRRATLGQRILQIQVGNAADGRPLRLEQGVRRWLGLGAFLDLLTLLPGMVALSGLSLLWGLVLLITTATSPTKQGLHDKFAESAVVRPTTAGNAMVVGCIVLLAIVAILAVLAVVGLIALGSQMSEILSQVGESVDAS